MKIQIPALKTELSSEISSLEQKASECREWMTRISTFDLSSYGLDGEGFEAETKKIRSQAEYPRAFFLLQDAVRRGDEKNQTELNKLDSSESDGSVDTEHLKSVIEKASTMIRLAEEFRDAANNGLNPLSWATTLLSNKAISSLNAMVAECRMKIAKVREYATASSGFYTDASAISALAAKANSSLNEVAKGESIIDESWKKDLDGRWGKWIERNPDEMKKYMTADQKKAFDQARKNGWDKSDFYTKDGPNKDLWQGMARVPGWFLSEKMTAAATDAQEEMVHKQDVIGLQKISSWMFVPMHDKREVSYTYRLDASPSTNVKVYGFRKSDLLQKMMEESDRRLSRTPVPSAHDSSARKAKWADLTASNTLLHMENRIKPMAGAQGVYGRSPDGLEIRVGLSRSDDGKSTARLMLLAVESSMSTKGLTSLVPNICQNQAGLSGKPADVAVMAHDLQNKNGLDGYNFWYDAGGKILQDSMKEIFSAGAEGIPFFGPGISVAKFIGDEIAGVTDDFSERERADRLNMLSKAGKSMAESDLFGGIGYSMIFDGSSGAHEEDYTHPDNRFFADPTVQTHLREAVAAYNAATGLHFTLAQFNKDISHNAFALFDIHDHKKFLETKRFLDWCNEKVDLVYPSDIRDDDGMIIHKKGEEYDRSISRYDYLAHKNDYRFLALKK